ncbi:VOC family protein [Gallibacterium anatis]|uniref:Glyoxalase n=2 Tax=Gallibacterium anatis TaxID=750 RepID=A0A0A3AH88_9PAST|nr:VOC family protein [Gallibacterium anatis]AEC16964.1 fosfomycin resistance protein FosB [Gallibacterium anatis UMN179]KGQ39741.1 glyoxalase [Gallibacterium anatis]KGQ45434.1 glyoxalase [Gallibacterium anatis]KGQ52802.1 glyoxalase [Gallibacterium anatis 10672-6]KGQ66470.1 glyoxalase [Gallibacterium anatis]
MLNITHLDHLVLTVKDIDVSVAFYQKLGMKKQLFLGGRVALQFGQQKINLHQLGKEFEPKAKQVQAGSADLCFIVSEPLEQVLDYLKEQHLSIEEGIVERTGAVGKIRSIYLRDPDGNLIELSNYQ